jgi:hypothetical protein
VFEGGTPDHHYSTVGRFSADQIRDFFGACLIVALGTFRWN